MSYGYWCCRLFSQFLHLNPIWLERFSWINRSIFGQVRLLVFSISHSIYVWISRLYMFNKLFACKFCLFSYIYPDLMRFRVGLCVYLSGSNDWMSRGSSFTPLYIQKLCEGIAPLYSTNKFPLQIHPTTGLSPSLPPFY